MLYVFIGCLTFGVAFSIMSLVFGSSGQGDGGLDIDGLDGLDIDGGVDVNNAGVDSADAPSPLNPLVLSSAITGFGAIGLIAKTGFALGDLESTVISLGFAGVVGLAMFYGVVKFMYNSQSNTVFSLSDLINIEAEVLTPIPKNGLGEISYSINGMRHTISAKSSDGEAILRGSTVIIREVSGNVAIVQRKISLDELSSYETEDKKREQKRIDS